MPGAGVGGVKPLYTSTAHPAYRLESPRVLLKTPHAAPAARPRPSGIRSCDVGPGSVSSPQEPNVQARLRTPVLQQGRLHPRERVLAHLLGAFWEPVI